MANAAPTGRTKGNAQGNRATRSSGRPEDYSENAEVSLKSYIPSLSVCLFVCLFICWFICLFVCLCVRERECYAVGGAAMAASLLDWLRAWFDPKDLVESRELVKKLNLPESTSQFVMALRPKDSPESVVYLLSSWYFSEKAVRDVRELIAKAQPKAVVALVDLESIDSFREEERLAAKDGVPVEVPTSSFDVVRENFERDPIVPYDSRARVRLANSIFGTGAYGDVLEAKEAAAKVNALFRYIDYPYRSSAHPQPPAEGESSTPAETPSTSPDPVQDSSRQNLLANDNRVLDALNSEVTRRVTEGLRRMVTESPLAELHQWRKSTSQALAQMFGHNTSLSDTKPTTER